MMNLSRSKALVINAYVSMVIFFGREVGSTLQKKQASDGSSGNKPALLKLTGRKKSTRS